MKNARSFGLLLLLLLAQGSAPQAQVVADGSLGTTVTRAGRKAWTITDGARFDGNLFHSFTRFDIPTLGSATFSGPAGIDNIIARVSGARGSSIDGALRSTIPGANLYLINPRGIVFKENASLEVQGSFHASTADFLNLGAAGVFRATNPGASTLVSAPPSDFGFLPGPRAPITVSGATLEAPAGRSLTFTAGDIELAGATLRVANGGGISIRGGGLVVAGSLIANDHSSPGAGGDIDIALDGALAMSSNAAIASRVTGGGNGGDIVVRASGVALEGGSFMVSSASAAGASGAIKLESNAPVFLAGRFPVPGGSPVASGLYLISGGAGATGGIRVRAPAIEMGDGARIQTKALASGASGGIALRAGRIVLTSDGEIFTQTIRSGASGKVTLQADEVEVSGGASITSLGGNTDNPELGTGKSGDISIEASRSAVFQSDGGVFSTAVGMGKSGAITVRAPGIEVTDATISSTSYSQSRSGDVLLTGGSLRVSAGGAVQVQSNLGGGASLTVDTTDEVVLSGQAGTLIESHHSGPGKPGDMTISTSLLSLEGAATIHSFAGGGAEGGLLKVTADRVAIGGDARISASSFGGGGGLVDLHARQSLIIRAGRPDFLAGVVSESLFGTDAGALKITSPLVIVERGSISTTTSSGGDGGAIELHVGRLELIGNATISAVSQLGGGAGGNIFIDAYDSIAIGRATTSGAAAIGTEVGFDSTGSAGSIHIIAPALTMEQRRISSITHGSGDGGDIRLELGSLALRGGAVVTSSAERGSRGKGGSIHITASGTVDLFGQGKEPFNDPRPSGIFSKGSGFGKAGDIEIEAVRVLLGGGAAIAASSDRFGDAGSITIVATDSLQLAGGSTISTEAKFTDGGNIDIRAGNLVALLDSAITTSVGTGEGTGGNITIDPVFVVLDGSRIVAQAFEGPGGNIRIVSQFFIASEDSLVDASSQRGISGTVTIASPQVDLGSGLAVLERAFFDASSLIRESCASRAGRSASTFIGAGRGGLAAQPGAQPAAAPALAAAYPVLLAGAGCHGAPRRR